MAYHGPILVMRYGPLIGYRDEPGGRRIVTVAKRCYTVAQALAYLRPGAGRPAGAMMWLARKDQPAHKTRRAR